MWHLKDSGFTLMEVMIAAAILAVIMSIVYGTFSGSIKTMEIGEERGEAYRTARLILNRIAQEISCSYLPPEQDLPDITYAFIGEDGEEEGLPRDTLHFISTSPPVWGPVRGLKEVGYFITPDPQTGEPILMMREDTTIDDRSDEGGRRYPLGKRITGLDFTYYDARGREWERWDSTSRVFEGRLPTVVKISLVFMDEGGKAVPLTTTTHIPLGED